MNLEEVHTAVAKQLFPWQLYRAKANFCHLISKVFGNTDWQDTNDPLGEWCSWGSLRPYFSKHRFPSLSPFATAQPAPSPALPNSHPSQKEAGCIFSTDIPMHGVLGKSLQRLKKEEVNLFPREGLPQLADSFISPGFLNIPFILMCCLFIKYCWKETEFWIIGQ